VSWFRIFTAVLAALVVFSVATTVIAVVLANAGSEAPRTGKVRTVPPPKR
jgi:hypothetical protein